MNQNGMEARFEQLKQQQAAMKSAVELCTEADNFIINRAGGGTQVSHWAGVPRSIYDLVDLKNMGNRFRKLYAQYPNELMALVELAQTKDKPRHWFASMTGKTCKACKTMIKGGEQCLEHLNGSVGAVYDYFVAVTVKFVHDVLFKVRETVAKVAEKLGTPITAFLYKQAWLGKNIERWADWTLEAAAMGKVKTSKVQLFNWYCINKDAGSQLWVGK